MNVRLVMILLKVEPNECEINNDFVQGKINECEITMTTFVTM